MVAVVLAQETTALMLLVHTVAIALYLCLSLVLLNALFRLRQTGERPAGFLAIVMLILSASLARTAWLVLFWLGFSPPPRLDLVTLCLVYASSMSTPIILSAFHLPLGIQQGRRSRVHLLLHWSMIANASMGALVLLIAFTRGSRFLSLLVIPVIYALAAVLLCARVASEQSMTVRRRGLLLFAAFTSAGLLTVAFVLMYGWIHQIVVRRVARTATVLEFSSLLIVIGMVFVFANLRLADVIVKRVLRLALWICAALSVWIGTTLLTQGLPPRAGVRAEAFRNLLALALIASYGAATPACLRLLDQWIDRWLFQQPNFDAAISTLWERLIHHKTTAEVVHAAAEIIRDTLSLSAVCVMSPGEAGTPEAVPVTGPVPHFVQPFGVQGKLMPVPADLLLPLFVEGSPAHYIVLSRGIMRPPLTAMELAFVERVAAQVQVRLETILAEERRLADVRRETAFREELTDAELRALRAQINPHFLFNSLNTIADLTVTAPERAEQMTLRLSAVFRYVLVNTDKQFVSLREEIDFARSYLEIEEFRFGDRLRALFEIDPELLERRVPTLLLQPLIENALMHGLAPRRSGGTIRIVAKSTEGGVTLIVADDGIGLRRSAETTSLSGTHVGLSNIRKRLATAYQGFASFQLNPREGGGAEAVVVIGKRSETV